MIPKFVWDEKYSVGIESIDKQHEVFFSTADELIGLLERGNATKEQLRAAIVKLEEHGFAHFETEERYFDLLHYDGAASHIEEHNIYRQRVGFYMDEINKPDVNLQRLAEEVATYAVYWLTNHILEVDRKYSVFFKEHGVK